MSEEYDIFDEFLKKQNLRMTAVRKEIIKYLENTGDEFSAADLHARIRVAGVPLNAASLYRNLILLKKAGLIELAPEKKEGKNVFRPKKINGRRYELHCFGSRQDQLLHDEGLDRAILSICAQYGLEEEGILVHINARHKKTGKDK